MKKPKNLGFEPVHTKNVLLASVVHGISCFLSMFFHGLLKFLVEKRTVENSSQSTEVINHPFTILLDSYKGL
jgi:hypothetical protein